jgi:hypothetical protein
MSELSLVAKMGPVAIVNISEYGCDVMILLPGLADEIIHVPLHDFTVHEAQALAEYLASIAGRGDRFPVLIEGAWDRDDIFAYILSELWLKIVHPVLNALAITVSYLINPCNPHPNCFFRLQPAKIWDASGGVQRGH